MSSPKPFVLFFNPVQHVMPFFQKLQEVAHMEVITSKSREKFFKDTPLLFLRSQDRLPQP
ncbi:hypothetical protein N7527_007668 [Penicillium freii]|nr:hypothetical protein N7527_007668 [Penicillium freii]